MVEFVKVESVKDIKMLAVLANEIWHEHFVSIIGKAQTDYMVEKFQSFEAMSEQINKKNYSYYAIKVDGTTIGYFAIVPENGKLFLSKLYIKKEHRGNGYASCAFEFMRNYCRKNGLSCIWLTVNRNNRSSIEIYLYQGFEIITTKAADIGCGFVMDDYIMEMKVTNE